MNTKILSCSCKHDYQDKMYGKGQRAHNHTEKKPVHQWRCTVCGAQKHTGDK